MYSHLQYWFELVNLLNEKPIMPPPFPSYGISTESDKLEDDMRKLKWQGNLFCYNNKNLKYFSIFQFF